MITKSVNKSFWIVLAVFLVFASSEVFGGSISGRVVSYDGNTPLEGVWINLHQGTDQYIADKDAWNWVGWTYTNSNGEYQFTGLEERRYRVHVWGQKVSGTAYYEADLYNVQVFAGTNTPNMNLQLRRAGIIYGYVRTKEGVPIPHTEVLAEAPWIEEGTSWHSTSTDATGRYELYLAPSPGKFYPVWVRNASLGGISYESKWDGNLYKASLTDTQVDYGLEPAGTATGRVVSEDGNGIKDVHVTCQWNKYKMGQGNWELTDADGYFALGGLPSGINYINLDNGWREIRQDGVKYMVGDAYRGPLNISAGDVCDVGTFTIYKAGMVTGIVTDQAGFPIVGVEIEIDGKDIEGNWTDRDEVCTDSFGQFTIDYVAPGTYRLNCSKDGFLDAHIIDLTVNRSQHVDIDLVMKSAAEAAKVSGSITNYLDIAFYDSNGVRLPCYDDSDYDEYGYSEFGLIAVPMDQTFTEKDYLDIDRCIVSGIGEEGFDDGYGDYFEHDANETLGKYNMMLPSGDLAIGMYTSYNFLPGWGGCAILHDWKGFNFSKGESVENVNFTVVTTNTGTLKGNLTVPVGYNYFPEAWCWIYAYALDENNHIKNAIPVGDAVAFPGYTTTYEFRNLPASKYKLKAYARNLASVFDLPPVIVTAGQPTTQNIVFTSGSTLTGHITDANSGADVNDAVVTIQETGEQITADDSGIYTITGINPGVYTVEAIASGYASVEVVDVNIEPNSTVIQNFILNPNVGSISGVVKDTDGNNINGVTVLAYNKTDQIFKTAQTIGGAFSITELTPGEYVLAVNTNDYGYGVVVYPSGDGIIPLPPKGAISGIEIVAGTPQPPNFTVYSTFTTDGNATLAIKFYSDINLVDEPNITVVPGTGNGTLEDLVTDPNLNHFDVNYIPAGSDSLVLIKIEETTPVVPGQPSSKTFAFEVSSNLVQTSSTNVTNAMGGQAAIMGTQDNTNIYVPPFAITGANDTQALTLTIERYGDPGDALPGTTDTSVTALYDFEFENGISVDINHSLTVTMGFQLPDGMTQQEFQSSLEVKYFDAGDQQWKTEGIANVRVNWANSTITFDVSHLTKFAAFVKSSVCSAPATIKVVIPDNGDVVQDGVTLAVDANDADGVDAVLFYIREPNDGNGVPIGHEELSATLNAVTGNWEYAFDTTQLPDGYYVVLAKAVDSCGNIGWSQVVPFSIRNSATTKILPATEKIKAGSIVPIKFSLRIAAKKAQASMPFVYNEDLEIRIYKKARPTNILLQTSLYGTEATDYRIDLVEKLYITNFQTESVRATYVVEVWRSTKNFKVGSFTFATTK